MMLAYPASRSLVRREDIWHLTAGACNKCLHGSLAHLVPSRFYNARMSRHISCESKISLFGFVRQIPHPLFRAPRGVVPTSGPSPAWHSQKLNEFPAPRMTDEASSLPSNIFVIISGALINQLHSLGIPFPDKDRQKANTRHSANTPAQTYDKHPSHNEPLTRISYHLTLLLPKTLKT